MTESIKESVGKKGKNNSDDVKLIQTRLNLYVAAKFLGSRPLLTVDGNATATVPYIEDFQRLVVGLKEPDGTISPLPGITMTRLAETPTLLPSALSRVLAKDNIDRGPPCPSIAEDAWRNALLALLYYADHPGLRRPNLLTLVNFDLGRSKAHLWVVELTKRTIRHHTWVAHGSGPKNANGHHIMPQRDIAMHFEDRNKYSSLGPYLTGSPISVTAGNLTKAPGMKIHGLHAGVNGRAAAREVVFHGATYVKDGDVDNSWGCFATSPKVNPDIIETIRYGSFVYAHHNTYKPKGS